MGRRCVLDSKAKAAQVSLAMPCAPPELSPVLQCICTAPSYTTNYQKKKGVEDIESTARVFKT